MTNVEENEEQLEDVRAKFYANPVVVRYIKTNGIPKSNRAFKDMVASGTAEGLDSEKGLKLMACLGHIVFRNHAQQINIMDKSSGKTIASIAR